MFGSEFFGFRPRRGSALGDPLLDGRDVGVGQALFFLGHLAFFEQGEQVAFRRVAGHDGRTGFAALLDEAPQPHVEPALGFAALAVAVETLRLQDGAHVFLESQRRRRRGRAVGKPTPRISSAARFPPTASGVWIRLKTMVFSPEKRTSKG